MQSADVMVAISNAMANSPNLEKNLDGPALVIMVESPSVITKHPVFEINRFRVTRGDWNWQ
jgi:hypothetical protein